MPPGYQAVQSAHALIDFTFEHPSLSDDWHEFSNTLVCLQAEDENHLNRISELLSRLKIEHQKFHEPDIENSLTSIAFMSDKKSRKLFSKFPLLLKSNS